MDTTRRIRAFASAGILALFLAASGSNAQAPASEPAGAFIGVITANDVYVRAGGGDSYYPFGKLNRGNLVKVIGEKYDWARVLTTGPSFASFFAYVEVDPTRVTLEPDGRRLRTSFRADLLAPNLNSKYKPADSWRRILDLKPGRTLAVLETIETNRKSVHKVPLPADAEGWISTDYVRPANPEEIAQWEKLTRPVAAKPAGVGGVTRPDGSKVVSEGARANDSAVLARDEPRLSGPVTPPAATDTTAPPVVPPTVTTANPPAGTRLEPPVRTPAQTQTQTQAQTRTQTTGETTSAERPPIETRVADNRPAQLDEPAKTTRVTAEPEVTAPASPVVEAKPAKATPAPSPRARLETLEAAYQRLRAEPIHSAEVLPLRELYDELATEANERSRTVAQYARARSEQLTIWADLQSRRLEVDRIRHRLSLTSDEAQALRLAVDNAGQYVAVGRLADSRIYDGQRLPRLFRIQDAETGRTIVYLRPDPAFDLTAMIGQIVGVMGQRAGDDVLPVTLVKPRRIDMIAAAEPTG
ncbi:MAG: hypothetical protein HKN62_11135 [Phycisphaerales bacterium]|nr:hypothetical protein [Phycisphaerales bacterium]